MIINDTEEGAAHLRILALFQSSVYNIILRHTEEGAGDMKRFDVAYTKAILARYLVWTCKCIKYNNNGYCGKCW